MNASIFKKIVGAAMAAVVLSAGSVSAIAPPMSWSWDCSGSASNVTCTFDEINGTFTVSGTGSMRSIPISSPEPPPWYDIRLSVINMVVEDGVVSLGANVFHGFTNLESITIGSTLANYFDDAFPFNGVPGSVTSITINQPVPPNWNNPFSNVDKTVACLNVPRGSEDAYLEESWWSDFQCFNPSTVTFNITVGFGEIEPITVSYGEKITRPEDPPFNGPSTTIFDGWYKDADFVDEWDFDVDVITSDITLYARWRSITSILSADREIPQAEEFTVVAPTARAPSSLIVGPNPVDRSNGVVRFYLTPTPSTGTLTIFDPTGNLIRRIDVVDVLDVVEWDLRDSRGRPVTEGSYLIRGSIRTATGTTERVSVILGVR